MFEQLPQQNPENNVSNEVLIPLGSNQVITGTVSYDKVQIYSVRNSDKTKTDIRLVWVTYNERGPDGEIHTQTIQVSDHHFTAQGQKDLMDKFVGLNREGDE